MCYKGWGNDDSCLFLILNQKLKIFLFFFYPQTQFSPSWHDRPGDESPSLSPAVRSGLPLSCPSSFMTFLFCTFGSTTIKGVETTPKASP